MQNLCLKCSPKDILGATGWTLNCSKCHLSKPTSENILKKTAQHAPNQPLKSLKSSVWCTWNHCFQLSTFAATCQEKCPQVAPIWDTSATKTRKNIPQDSSKSQQKNTLQNKQNPYEKALLFCLLVVNVFVFFSTGLTSPPKSGPGPKKVYNMKF